MQIQQTNTNPVFRGYVGAQLKRLINVNVTKECTASVKYHLKRKEKPSMHVIWMMNNFGKGMLNGLGRYMNKLHSKTYLTVIKGSDSNYIALKNPITRKNFFIVKNNSGELSISQTPKDSIGKFSEKTLPFGILEQVLEFMDSLVTMNPKKIDKAILAAVDKPASEETFPNMIAKLKSKIRTSRIEKYRQEINR